MGFWILDSGFCGGALPCHANASDTQPQQIQAEIHFKLGQEQLQLPLSSLFPHKTGAALALALQRFGRVLSSNRWTMPNKDNNQPRLEEQEQHWSTR